MGTNLCDGMWAFGSIHLAGNFKPNILERLIAKTSGLIFAKFCNFQTACCYNLGDTIFLESLFQI